MHEADQNEQRYLEDLTDEELNAMSDEDFANVVKAIPTPTKSELRRYMKMMSRHKPVNEKTKAKRKITARKKAKVQKQSRKANR